MGEAVEQGENIFETIKHIDQKTGLEYWNARELAPVLGYKQWRNFLEVIDRAKAAMVQLGVPVENHFANVRKMVEVGSNTMRETLDIKLTRLACYTVAQNGDATKKREIALAQAYFTHQTRRQELADIEEKERKRIDARQKLTISDKKLSSVAMNRGVDSIQLAQIKSQGDKRLFGGNDTGAMKQKYGIANTKKPLADHLPTIALTAKQLANEMTSINTETKDLKGFGKIGMEHVNNNIEVRKSLVARGIKLEELPPEEDIKKVERRLKTEKRRRLKSEKDKLIKSDFKGRGENR